MEKAAYDLLVDVNSKEESIEFYTRNNDQWITDLLFIAEDFGEFVFMHLEGKWPMADIINRSRAID